MFELSKEHLKNCFEGAKRADANIVGLLIEMPNFEAPELIINPKENFDKKLEYLLNTYDEYLEHKYSKGVRIIAFTYGKRIEEVTNDLFIKVRD